VGRSPRRHQRRARAKNFERKRSRDSSSDDDGGRRAKNCRGGFERKCVVSVLVGKNTKIVVQGITGGAGSFHAKQMMEYGSNVVAGCTPTRGGETFDGGAKKVPVFDTVAEAVQKAGADTSCIFVPPPGTADAMQFSE